jgi:hypothetical protein
MPNLELLALTAEELGGQTPQAGSELTVCGQRYHVVETAPPATKPPSDWRHKPVGETAAKWRLLALRPN